MHILGGHRQFNYNYIDHPQLAWQQSVRKFIYICIEYEKYCVQIVTY